jgi:hypothetical protein
MTAGLAWGGLVLGHLGTYLLNYREEATRHTHLAMTGHGAFHLAVLAAAALIPVVLALIAARAASSEEPPAPIRTARSLAALQLPLFVGMEIVERGLRVVPALTDRAVISGLLIQVAMAVALGLLVTVLFRSVRTFVAGFRKTFTSARRAFRSRPSAVIHPRRPDLLTGPRRRAPPLPAAR